MATRDTDGTRRGAKRLGVLDGVKRVRSTLNVDNDLTDYYLFSVTGRSSLTLNLSELQDNANLALLSSTGRVLRSSNRGGTRPEAINYTLESAGQYYIQVSLLGEQTRYLLRAATSAAPVPAPVPGSPSPSPIPGGSPSPTPGGPPPVPPGAEPGAIPALAFDTGVLSTPKAYRDTVGGADAADYYRFTVTQSSRVTITTGNVSGGTVGTNLVYDINGNGFVDEGDVVATGDSITKSLTPGSYFVGIVPQSGTNVAYDLTLSPTVITGINPTTDPPIGLGNATNLGTVSGLTGLRQVVGSTDSTDVYKFTLSSVSNFSVLLNTAQQTSDVTVSLIYDDDGNGIANPGLLNAKGLVVGGNFIGGVFTAGSANGSTLAINKTLGAGTYYLAVTQKKVIDNSTYDLNLFVNNTVTGITPNADPGNSIPAVRDNPADPGNLGTITGPINVRQFVGSVDGSDYYRFTLASTRNIIIRYNGSPEQVALRLGQDRNNDGSFTINPGEDVNNNGSLDQGEDLNNNGLLDRDNEVFENSLAGNVVYSPLPPFYTSGASFDTRPEVNGFLTTVPTDIYARLPAGTYYLQVDPQAVSVDLGDGLTRYGSANVLYNLSFLLDG